MSLSKHHHPYHHEISRNISKLTVHSLFFFFFFRRNKSWFSIKNKKEIKYSNHQPSCCLLSLSFHTLMSYLLKPGRALGTKGSFLKEALFLRCIWWIHCFSIHRVCTIFQKQISWTPSGLRWIFPWLQISPCTLSFPIFQNQLSLWFTWISFHINSWNLIAWVRISRNS